MRTKKDYLRLVDQMLRSSAAPLPAMQELPMAFYQREATEVAKDLLGKILLLRRPGSPEMAARIVETEAYMGVTDRAAHSCNGRRTARTAVLYGPGGGVYIYLIYGMYACVNLVCNRPDIPQAALIRAVEPMTGLEEMCKARFGCTPLELIDKKGAKALAQLSNGPGKLCRALSLTPKESGLDVFSSYIHVGAESTPSAFEVVQTTRIGVDYAGEDALLPYRYYIKENPFVSKL